MAARNVARRIELDADTRSQMEALAHSRSLPHALVVRAQIILMACEGMKSIDIAEKVGLRRESVGKWRTRFLQGGLNGLYDELRPGRPRQIEEERIARLIAKTLHSTPRGQTQWSCRTMSKSSGLSKSTVQRVWSAFGVQPHRQRQFKLSNDPFFVEKVCDIVGLYLHPPQKAMVLCVDEKSQCQALERTQPSLPLGLGYVQGYTHDYARHGTTTLFAALDIANGQVLTQCRPHHRHQEFLSFLRLIERNVPDQLEVHLVVDNYGSHKHATIKGWLARHQRFHLHFTPNYSSWLNQVERWFSLITQRAIRRGSFTSVKDLVTKIDEFVQSYNEDSTPFVWHATAESILAKVGRLCEAISGTGH
jgi:putative transposase